MKTEVQHTLFTCDSCGNKETAGARVTAPDEWADIRIEERTDLGSDVNRFHVCARCLPGIYSRLGRPDAD